MSNNLVWAKEKGVITITITGGFDSHLVQSFRKVFLEFDKMDNKIVVDLQEAEYIDSAALGLMIHMKKRLKEFDVENIQVINCNERILKVFQTMRFADMFEIEGL